MRTEQTGLSALRLAGALLCALSTQCGAPDGTSSTSGEGTALATPGGGEDIGSGVEELRTVDQQGRRRREPKSDDLYVGCRDATGTIQHYEISRGTGAVTLVDTAFANASVSNTAMDVSERFLYVAHADTGRITTFSRDPATGTLTLDAFVAVPGTPDPASNPATQTLEIDHTGRFLLAANYTANTVLVYTLDANGTVGDLVATREDGLNAHQTLLNVRNRFALVPYFGSNYVAVYRFDPKSGGLTPNVPFTTDIPVANSGPRHLALHPNTTWLYVISETAGSITFFRFDNRTGTLAYRQTVSSLPADFAGALRSGSELEIDDAGRFLYVSNRLDQIANGILGVYAISAHDGTLAPIQFEDSRGATPRQFSLSPQGDLLVVGNQSSSNMSVFKVNEATGKLTYVATTPVCSTPFFARMVAP
jgi:6-phosphogluconolactonase